MEVIRHSCQLVHMRVRWRDNQAWFLTMVYGALKVVGMQTLWDDLFYISNGLTRKWDVIGDFNSTLSTTESIGSCNFHGHHVMHLF